MAISNFRLFCCRLLLLLPLLACLGLFAPSAHADGGAPQLAYVAGTDQGVTVITIAQRRVTGTMAVPGNPRTILLSPDGQWLYVTQPDLGRVEVLTAKTGKAHCSAKLPGQPSLLALSLDATMLFAAGQGDTRVSALNPTTCAIQRTFETHEPVYGLAVAASTAANATPSTPNQLWIAGSTSLTVFDVTGQLLGTVPIAAGPQHISIPSGFTAYVTTQQGTLVAVDLNSRRVIGTLLSGGQFGAMDFDETTGEVYVPDQAHNQLDILTPVTANGTTTPHEPARVLHVSASPISVAITSDGQLGFVALTNGQVDMLDIPGHSIVTTITVGGTPHFIITGLYPPATSVSSHPTQVDTSSPQIINSLFMLVSMGLLVVFVLGAGWFFWRRR